jgi:hypothetical protein
MESHSWQTYRPNRQLPVPKSRGGNSENKLQLILSDEILTFLFQSLNKSGIV